MKEDGQKVSDEQIKEYLLEEIAGDGFNYGYRKLTKLLRRKYHLIINKKKVYRLCKELDILRPQRQKKVSYPRKLARNRTIKSSNKLWEIDIKYGYIEGEDRSIFSSFCPKSYFSHFWNGIKGDDSRAKPLPLKEWKQWL
ncbi:hypothetical protein B5V88_02120 [Heyndrickxia sporothermodurans]|nr:hypothetical protein B5V88_02120 [Heyndrickxia sporothermodurans]